MKGNTKKKLIVVLGPTSSGKSELAVEIAKTINGEIISADSRQVYKGLDIGSGKITKKEMRGVPHHLLDVANPKKIFPLPLYQKMTLSAISDIHARKKTPIICGGTGQYIQAVIDGIIVPEVPPDTILRKKLENKNSAELHLMLKKLDPRRAEEIDCQNPVRLIRAIEVATKLGAVPPLVKRTPDYSIQQIGLNPDKETLKQKITVRLAKRLRAGMMEEAKNLHNKGLSWKRMRELGLDYRALADFLTKKLSEKEMREVIIKGNADYAKRQMTWFKKDKRIIWFNPSEKEKILKTVNDFLSHFD